MRFKEVKKIIKEAEEAQQLMEINMSPSSLRQLAAAIDAKAGMEFEMIVPDAEDSDDNGEQEPDYEQDESCSDIQEIYDFFYDGDFNSRRDCERLRDDMRQRYSEWLMDKSGDEWDERAIDLVYQYVRDNASDEEVAEALGIEPDEETGDYDIGKKQYADYAEYCINEQNEYYDSARDDFISDFVNDEDHEGEWLEHEGLHAMSDVERDYNIGWPHWISTRQPGRTVQEIAQEFGNAIGRPVNSSNSYHGARREEGRYVVEPDGSLEGDNPGDSGLEFVSPPLPVNELLDDLNKVKKWADSEGCYTGASNNTGLHINVSVPGYSLANLDYVKLALLLGDEHVLDSFERLGNDYCKSGLGIVKRAIKQNPENAKALLDQMRNQMSDLATKAIHGGVTQKFTSINTKDGYVEFRSPGGDWLNEHFDKIENTLLRFVVALDAATKPEMYREEYLKKLYKVLEPAGNKDTIKYFSQYVAGQIPVQALKSFVRQAQLERDIANDPNKGKDKWWWNVKVDGQRIEVVAKDNNDAWKRALDANPEWMHFSQGQADISPVRPYDGNSTQQDPIRQAVGRNIAQAAAVDRPSNPDGNYIIATHDNPFTPVYRFMAASPDDALVVLRQWRAANPSTNDNWIIKADPEQRLGQPEANPLRPTGPGPWQLYNTHNDAVLVDLTRTNRSDAEREARTWASINHLNTTGLAIRTRPVTPERSLRGGENDAALAMARDAVFGTNQQPNWEIQRDSDNEIVVRFHAPNQDDAIRQAVDFVNRQGWNIEEYTVQAIEPSANQRALPGSTVDLQRQRAQGGFTGSWRLVDGSGTEVYRFSGVGNSQHDANSTAARWLQSQGIIDSSQYEVYPIMGNPEPPAQHFQAPERMRQEEPYEIYRLSDGQVVHRFQASNQFAAWDEARRFLGNNPTMGSLNQYSARRVE
jgi:uncharacterized protein YegP (UPF0339 family)